MLLVEQTEAAPKTTATTAVPPDARPGWSNRELLAVVSTGVVITVIWLLFRRLKFPGV